MKKGLSILTLVLGLAVFSSCSDFLSLKPSTSDVASNAMTNTAEAQVAINGLMRQLTSTAYYGRQFTIYADMKGGDFFVPSLGRGDDALFTFTHEENNAAYGGFWSQIHFCLLQANNILENIEGGKVATVSANDATTLADIKGQALAIRALCHFDMVRLYGLPYTKPGAPESFGAPVVTKVLPATAKELRSTVQEVYDQVVKDLLAAIPSLSTSKKNGFVNRYGAKALLARVYLYMGNYDEAFTLAEDVITNGGYTLYTNDKWVASWSKQGDTESIFELIMNPDENDRGTSSLTYFLRPQKVTSNAWAAAVAGDSFIARLGEDPDDVRWGVMGKDEYALDATNPHYDPDHMGRIMKYEGDGKSTVTATNIKVIRLSEIYLIAAEAAFKKSNPDRVKSVSYLNEIRKRAPNLVAANTSDDLEALILKERSKELLAEGHRFFDLIRLNKSVVFDPSKDFVIAPNGRQDSFNWDYYKIVLPIPLAEINANPEIKSQQNSGY